MNNMQMTPGSTAVQKVNSILFQIECLKQIRFNDVDQTIVGAELDCSDPLFPILKYGGYNKLNECDEDFIIQCWDWYDDTRSDLIEHYKETGESPAWPFEHIKGAVRSKIFILEMSELGIAKQRIKDEEIRDKRIEEAKNDECVYYTSENNLIIKHDPDTDEDYVFVDGKWGLSTDQSDDMHVIPRDEAMKIITCQTLEFLKDMWREKYAREKEDWDKNPGWPAKLVRTDYVLNGIEGSITAKDLPFSSGPYFEGFFESIQTGIESDLQKYGAYITSSTGMLD